MTAHPLRRIRHLCGGNRKREINAIRMVNRVASLPTPRRTEEPMGGPHTRPVTFPGFAYDTHGRPRLNWCSPPGTDPFDTTTPEHTLSDDLSRDGVTMCLTDERHCEKDRRIHLFVSHP